MRYATNSYHDTARLIAKSAEQQIKEKTGICVTLIVCPGYNPQKSPEQMLRVIAGALNMDAGCYKKKTRERDFVDLRFIGAFLLRSFFPAITLHSITLFFGGQDHTSILNGLARAEMLLACGDDRFTTKYNTALRSVNKWLRKESAAFTQAVTA